MLLSSVNLYERCCIIVKVVVLICIGEVPSSEFAQGPGIMTYITVVLLVLPSDARIVPLSPNNFAVMQ